MPGLPTSIQPWGCTLSGVLLKWHLPAAAAPCSQKPFAFVCPPPSYCYSSPPETAGVGGALFAPGADCPGYPEAGREGLALNMLTWEKGIQLKSRGMISYWHAPFVSFRKKWEMLLCQRRVKLRRDMKSHVF